MTDIYTIKDIVLGMPVSLEYTIIVCILFFGLYFFIFLKKKNKKIKIFTKIILKEKINYELLLNSKDFLSMKSNDFLKEVSIFFRDYIEESLNIEDFSKLTFNEIEKLKIDTGYKLLIKDIYFREYKKEEILEKDKKRIFNEIKAIIINNRNENI